MKNTGMLLPTRSQLPFVGVELHREAADVPGRVGRAALAEHGREADEDRCLLADLAKERRARELGDGLGALEEAVRRRAARVDDPLGDALVVEVGDLLAKDEVLEERRATQAGLQRVLIVRDGDALIGRERAVGRIDAHAIERTDRGILADVRTTAADLVGPVHFGDRAGPDDDPRADPPPQGRSAPGFPLFGLKGNADARSCVPAAFSATMSPAPEASGSAGPLTVVRLLRTVLLFLATR